MEIAKQLFGLQKQILMDFIFRLAACEVLVNDGTFGGVSSLSSGSFELDTKNPVVSLVRVDGSTQYGTNPSNVYTTLTDDTIQAGTRGTMEFSLDPNFTNASYIPYTANATFMLNSTNNTSTLYWRFKDDKNNITAGSTTPPERPSNLWCKIFPI
jgi:hypothetical protein